MQNNNLAYYDPLLKGERDFGDDGFERLQQHSDIQLIRWAKEKTCHCA